MIIWEPYVMSQEKVNEKKKKETPKCNYFFFYFFLSSVCTLANCLEMYTVFRVTGVTHAGCAVV